MSDHRGDQNRDGNDDPSARRGGITALLPRAQPWAALALSAFVMHWMWEMLQAPLFSSMQAMPVGKATWVCTVASAGDVALALVAYGAVAAAVRDRGWLLHLRPWRVVGYLAVGLALTAALETLSVEYWGRWSYAPGMPRVLGVGLAPLLQWIVIPLATLWAGRRYLGRSAHGSASSGSSRHRSNTSGDST